MDTTFINRHFCNRNEQQGRDLPDSKQISWWLQTVHQLSVDFSTNDNISLWLTSCPGHGVTRGRVKYILFVAPLVRIVI